MKKIIFSLFVLFYFTFAQDSTLIPAGADSLLDSQKINAPAPLKEVNLNDFKKFYIGFTTNDEMLEVITLDIKDIAEVDSNITFQYTLNTHNNREDGTGNIWPNESIIRFQNMEEGRISIPEDGKIVFESLTQDSLKYWKLKEK